MAVNITWARARARVELRVDLVNDFDAPRMCDPKARALPGRRLATTCGTAFPGLGWERRGPLAAALTASPLPL